MVSVEDFVSAIAWFDVDDSEVVGGVLLEQSEVVGESVGVAVLVFVDVEFREWDALDGECCGAGDQRLAFVPVNAFDHQPSECCKCVGV